MPEASSFEGKSPPFRGKQLPLVEQEVGKKCTLSLDTCAEGVVLCIHGSSITESTMSDISYYPYNACIKRVVLPIPPISDNKLAQATRFNSNPNQSRFCCCGSVTNPVLRAVAGLSQRKQYWPPSNSPPTIGPPKKSGLASPVAGSSSTSVLPSGPSQNPKIDSHAIFPSSTGSYRSQHGIQYRLDWDAGNGEYTWKLVCERRNGCP